MPMHGAQSEEKACGFLRDHGYRIIGRNWRTRSGEIDIIARDGDTIVFVEVKARSSDGFGGAEAAVNYVKQQRVIAAAQAFIEQTQCELPTRFDVVAIRPRSVSHYEDAFRV